MNPARWKTLNQLFLGVLELDAERREPYLTKSCGDDKDLLARVQKLLDAHHGTGPLDKLPDTIAGLAFSEIDLREKKGMRVGNYILLKELGHGGMGSVYLAERIDGQFEQQVAVKFLRTGFTNDEQNWRFFAERRILASLGHKNIARLLDGGVTGEGQPYFVMEYIEGATLTEYCDTHSHDVRRRLELFIQVCEAVQYAHRKLVVHRDIKPSNILVNREGTVKLLDFGIAKMLNDERPSDETKPHTRTGLLPLTPKYASPEQIRGKSVTTASDIYQLGIVLYELLTGMHPYETDGRTPGEVERIVCDEDPVKPSSALTRPQARYSGAHLNGDMDAIVMKAIHKDPERRYGSAEQFSEDLKRFLAGQPVAAHPDSFLYRSGKFIKRYKAVVAACSIAFIFLAGGIVSTAWQARNAISERNRAQFEASRAEQVSSFLIDLFTGADPRNAPGEVLTAAELLDEGSRRIDELSGQPELQASVRDAIGRIYRDIGRHDDALRILESALDQRRTILPPDHPDIAESLTSLAVLLAYQGNLDESQRLSLEAVRIYGGLYGPVHEKIATSYNNLAAIHLERGETNSAEVFLREAVSIRRDLGMETQPAFATNLDGLALTLQRMERLDEAEALYREALHIRQNALPTEHPDLVRSFNNLAGVLYKKRNYAEAEPLYREALSTWRNVSGEHHPDVAVAMNNLAAVLERLGHLDEAEKLYRESIEIKRSSVGNRHISMARSLTNLGLLLQSRGEYDAAEALLRESYTIRREWYDGKHPDVMRAEEALHNLLKEKSEGAGGERTALQQIPT
jgi:eukaryotic-like serine/threonine-protein kinase